MSRPQIDPKSTDPASLPFQAKAFLSGLVLLGGMAAAICFVTNAPERSQAEPETTVLLRRDDPATASAAVPQCIPSRDKQTHHRKSTSRGERPPEIASRSNKQEVEKSNAEPRLPEIDPSIFETQPTEPALLEKTCPLFDASLSISEEATLP
jgi:hypothetical protein